MTPEFLWHMFTSAWRVLVSIAAALLIGGGLAFLAHGVPWLGGVVDERIKPVLNSFPSIGWAILAAIWFEPGHFGVIFVEVAILIPFCLIQHRRGSAQHRSRDHGDGPELHAPPGAHPLASDFAPSGALRTFRDPHCLRDRLEDRAGCELLGAPSGRRFCWVLGDLFQQYAAKYIGISRGIPLSNTNQIWGLLWGALVFGELAGESLTARLLVIGGSLVMIVGALAISQAEAPASEQDSWRLASERECDRYGMDAERAAAILHGDDPLARETPPRHWWEFVVTLAAIGIFVWLGLHAKIPSIPMNIPVLLVLLAATVGFLIVCGRMLWKRTRFS